MSDDPKTPESGQEQANQELPIPKFENASADSSTSRTDTDAIAKAVLSQLMPEIEKKLQSTKDKRIAEIEKRLNAGQFAELEEMGAQIPENVKLEYRLRELEQRTTQPAKTTSQGSGVQMTAQDVLQVITDLKLDANDAAVIEALKSPYRNRDHFEASMARLALTRASKQPPSPSAAPAGNVPLSPPTSDETEVVAAYEKEMAALPRGSASIYARAEIKKKYRELARKRGFNLNV